MCSQFQYWIWPILLWESNLLSISILLQRFLMTYSWVLMSEIILYFVAFSCRLHIDSDICGQLDKSKLKAFSKLAIGWYIQQNDIHSFEMPIATTDQRIIYYYAIFSFLSCKIEFFINHSVCFGAKEWFWAIVI